MNDKKGKISVIGIGPGGEEHLTFRAHKAIREADLIIGYRSYIERVERLKKEDAQILSKGMGDEEERALISIDEAKKGKKVAMISGGDPGIYGMSSFLMKALKDLADDNSRLGEIEIVPGVSSISAAASSLGSPLMDHAVISLSDLRTPLSGIEDRIRAAAASDLVIVLSNPRSSTREKPLRRSLKIIKRYRGANTLVGVVKNAKRDGEERLITRLGELDPLDSIDMSTTIIVGNAYTQHVGDYLWTPRSCETKVGVSGKGREIEKRSFAAIDEGISIPDGLEKKLIMRTIHATGDASFGELLIFRNFAPEVGTKAIRSGCDVITDVKMVEVGIDRRGLRNFGGEVRNYIDLAYKSEAEGTRAELAMRYAIDEGVEGDIIAIGNSPTAVLEMVKWVKEGVKPALIIAVPPGFIDAERSKGMARGLDMPSITTTGTKGGSAVAISLVNQMLRECMDERSGQ